MTLFIFVLVLYNRLMTGDEKVKYWIELADDDIRTADVLFRNSIYLQCCFYCHQAVEKSTKAYYWRSKQAEPPYTHNIMRLARLSGLLERCDDSKRDYIALLSPLNTQIRYPEDKEHLSESMTLEKVRMIFEKAKEYVAWTRTFLMP